MKKAAQETENIGDSKFYSQTLLSKIFVVYIIKCLIVMRLLFFILLAPFMCPFCFAEGDNADSECEANIVNKPCSENIRDPICVLWDTPARFLASGMRLRLRECTERINYNDFKMNQGSGGYDVVMCDTSGCKPDFTTSGIRNHFIRDIWWGLA